MTLKIKYKLIDLRTTFESPLNSDKNCKTFARNTLKKPILECTDEGKQFCTLICIKHIKLNLIVFFNIH